MIAIKGSIAHGLVTVRLAQGQRVATAYALESPDPYPLAHGGIGAMADTAGMLAAGIAKTPEPRR